LWETVVWLEKKNPGPTTNYAQKPVIVDSIQHETEYGQALLFMEESFS